MSREIPPKAARPPHVWTPEERETVFRMWKNGMPASEIARSLAHFPSRNAVIGVVHRAGLKRDLPQVVRAVRAPRFRSAAELKAAQERAAKRAERMERKKIKSDVLALRSRVPNPFGPKSVEKVTDAKPLKPDVAFDPLPGSAPRPWEDRRSGECSWPVGDGLSCCEPVRAFGWCAVHVAVGREPPRKSTKALIRSLSRAAYYQTAVPGAA